MRPFIAVAIAHPRLDRGQSRAFLFIAEQMARLVDRIATKQIEARFEIAAQFADGRAPGHGDGIDGPRQGAERFGDQVGFVIPINEDVDRLLYFSHHHIVVNRDERSEEHTSESKSLMRNSYAVYC